jgi:hypothetical protein
MTRRHCVSILCLAHVTNTMAQSGDDFEKGAADGTDDALAVLSALVGAVQPSPGPLRGARDAKRRSPCIAQTCAAAGRTG